MIRSVVLSRQCVCLVGYEDWQNNTHKIKDITNAASHQTHSIEPIKWSCMLECIVFSVTTVVTITNSMKHNSKLQGIQNHWAECCGYLRDRIPSSATNWCKFKPKTLVPSQRYQTRSHLKPSSEHKSFLSAPTTRAGLKLSCTASVRRRKLMKVESCLLHCQWR